MNGDEGEGGGKKAGGGYSVVFSDSFSCTSDADTRPWPHHLLHRKGPGISFHSE